MKRLPESIEETFNQSIDYDRLDNLEEIFKKQHRMEGDKFRKISTMVNSSSQDGSDFGEQGDGNASHTTRLEMANETQNDEISLTSNLL